METSKKRADSVVSVMINQSVREMVFSVAGIGSATLHLGRLHPNVLDYAAFFGLKQSVGDKAAQSKDPTTGLPAPRQVKFDAIKARIDHLESGSADWSSRGQGMGGDVGLLIEAIIAAGLKVDSPEMRTKVRGLDKVQRDALANLPQVKAELDKLNAVRTAGIDAEALLASF